MRTLFRTCEILVIAFISCAGTLYSQTSPSAERAVDRIVAAEQRLLTRLQDLSPVVEIYVQSTQPDRDGGRPLTDAYFLGQLDSHPKANRGQSVGPSVRLLFGKNRSERKIRFFSGTVRTLYPEGFAVMLFPDMGEFDREHYIFRSRPGEWTGGVECLVFDVVPADPTEPGRFEGVIWADKKSFSIVRVKGTFTPYPSTQYIYLHFDSRRVPLAPNFWVPVFTYVEENDGNYSKGTAGMRLLSTVKVWGYSQSADRKQPDDNVAPLTDRGEPRKRGNAVTDLLGSHHLIAPPGTTEQKLDALIAEILRMNHLVEDQIHCRVLLSQPFDIFSVGSTIFVSRGLVNQVRDIGSMKVLLARQIATILLGHSDEVMAHPKDLFAESVMFSGFTAPETRQEEREADLLAQKLTAEAANTENLMSAENWLRNAASHEQLTPNLLRARFGGEGVLRQYAYLISGQRQWKTGAPQPLVSTRPQQLIEGELQVNPFTDSLVPEAVANSDGPIN